MTVRKKLIEVALPLLAINEASAREKSIRHGHPSTLHLWWARRPLAAARAVIWASLVDDPSSDTSLNLEEQAEERQRLFRILERMVVWENSNDPGVLAEARAEIDRCFPEGAPPVVDPFGGGGAIPLEAQRLGLTAITGDLNPVAVLIQKAMLEIPPRFANRPPVHPDLQNEMGHWIGTGGLAADIQKYGDWMREEAHRRIGHHYPAATGPTGEKLTPIAWIWARSVKSPDPAWGGHVPLVASWVLANRAGRAKVWMHPVIDQASRSIRFQIRTGGEPSHKRTVERGVGTCVASGATIPKDYIKEQGVLKQHSQMLMAVVAEGSSGRVYCEPRDEDASPCVDVSEDVLLGRMSNHPQYMGTVRYGLDEWNKLYTPRQFAALNTFSSLLKDAREKVVRDAKQAGVSSEKGRLSEGGDGAEAYADAIVTYLAFVVDKCAGYWASTCSWHSSGEKIRDTFGRQAIPMTWDFAEANPFSSSSGSWSGMLTWVRKAVESLPAYGRAVVKQQDALVTASTAGRAVISTDPPYYDAVPYADISDYFYVWLRKSLSDVWPNELSTILTPKADELVADSQRHGSREAAAEFFEDGMSRFMVAVATAQHDSSPATIYYAYKSTESSEGVQTSTGWSTFLQAVIDAGLKVTATWPLRTELANRMRGIASNALASSIVLVCRKREVTADLATRAEFSAALREELPEAVRLLQSGNITPVDIPQSTIGPGIGVFSRYARVVESDGSAMPVSVALSIINDVLGEILDGEESEMDADSRFALTWYSHFGFNPAPSGDADGMARAKNTSVTGVVEAGVGEARAGKFRLFERSELAAGWSPLTDKRPTVWEATQHLIAALARSESEAAELLRQLGSYAERARVLAYLLFKKASDKGWAEEAGAYNGLIVAWPALQVASAPMTQQTMKLG